MSERSRQEILLPEYVTPPLARSRASGLGSARDCLLRMSGVIATANESRHFFLWEMGGQ
jgi:hypothetical protein